MLWYPLFLHLTDKFFKLGNGNSDILGLFLDFFKKLAEGAVIIVVSALDPSNIKTCLITSTDLIIGVSTPPTVGIFFAICFPLSMLASHWEKKLKARDTVSVPVQKKADDITDAELDMIISGKGGEH